ncbi:hypothetical protein SDC9_196839 [bioreactor metagenome]|uniref:Uncharacterized protein n=1 Tax=bioreactor metagenome TaxID=1076179 RepID=A0A645ILN4_9ZZZZ
MHTAVHLVQRVGKVRRVKIRGKHRPIARKGGLHQLTLVDVKAAGRIGIHLLQQAKIRRNALQCADGPCRVVLYDLFALRAGMRTPHRRTVFHGTGVHKKRKIRVVGAKPNIIGCSGIVLPQLQLRCLPVLHR